MTEEEDAEYSNYIDEGDVIALLQAKARRLLARSNEGAQVWLMLGCGDSKSGWSGEVAVASIACCQGVRILTRYFTWKHVVGKQHGGSDDAANLAWACSRCNHRKGTNLSSRDPDTGQTVELFDPQTRLDGALCRCAAQIMGLSAPGRATVRLLDMNSSRRTRLRRELILQGEFPAT